jgi:hypothetical protein
MPNITRIPAQRVPVIEGPDNVMQREWYRFFNNAFTLLGLGQNQFSLEDVQTIPAIDTPQLITTRFGYFYDTTTQTAAAINVAYGMTFNSVGFQRGVTIGTPTSRIYVDRPGIFNIEFSAQLDKISGGTAFIFIWLRVNGVDVPDSASQIRIQGNNAEIVAAWNYLHEFNAGDYFEIMWSTDDTSCQILAAVASPPHPGIPSVILTVTNNI